MTSQDVACRFGVSLRTVAEWRADGWLPYRRIAGIRFTEGDIEEFVRRRARDRQAAKARAAS